MNRSPAFQFYAKDFLSDMNVVMMSLEEKGAYITLLSHLWIEGWLPNGSTKLQRLCGSPSNWNEIWSNIKHCFYENGGKIYHKRLDEEEEKQRLWREKSRAGGLRSAETRRGQKESKGASTIVQEPNEPNSNSSLASSSSIKKTTISFNKDSGKFEGIVKHLIDRWKKTYAYVDVHQTIKELESWRIANPNKHYKNNHKFLVNNISRENKKIREEKGDDLTEEEYKLQCKKALEERR